MMRMQPATSIPVPECLWGDPDDFSKFIDGIVFQWYHLNTILSINWLLSKIIYIILQLHFNCQEPLPPSKLALTGQTSAQSPPASPRTLPLLRAHPSRRVSSRV